MKVFARNLIIDRSMVSKVPKQAWPWEVPVLQARFGEGRVQLMDEVVVEVKGLPDPVDEYRRLANAYGSDGGDGGTNMSFVDLAYGRGRAGEDALAKAIKASTSSQDKPAKGKAKEDDKVAEKDSKETDPLDL